MAHLLVAGRLHPAGVQLLEALQGQGHSFDYIEEISEESYVPLVAGADALVLRTQRLTAETVARAGRLKVVSRHGVGYDAVDVAALNERGIALTIVGDVNSTSVAEHAMTQILAAAKCLLQAHRAARDVAQWNWRNRMQAREVCGKNLLILGYGRIGRRLARLAAGFDMQVRAYDPALQEAGWPEGAAKPAADLNAVLGWADFISLHIPKPPGGGAVIGADEIGRMKPGVVLCNTARGGVICEAALSAALESGHVAAAGLDVFEQEPPDGDAALLGRDDVILSPHNAGLTAEAGERMAVAAVQNAVDYLAGRLDAGLIVNRDFL